MGPTDPVGSGSRNGRHQLPQLSHNEAEAAIAKLFESAGFTVLSEPRISGVSSLPLNPDILAFKNDEVLIIEVKVGREKDIVAEDAQGRSEEHTSELQSRFD